MARISRVLIANRGEIALRIIRACKAMGVETVLAVSDVDRESLPARMADRSVCIGPGPSLESYLKVDTIVTACLGTGCQAVHPGYGFLAERDDFAQACERHGIKFIGPRAESMKQMGNKLWARKVAKKCGVRTIPGSEKVQDLAEASRISAEIGFPVMLKAAAGGGGRGMKVVSSAQELPHVFDALSEEVRSAFGDGTLYLEHYIPDARHIEVQILADRFGKVIHLGERDCSVQRRYQKVVEEAPSPAVTEDLRKEICAAAVSIARYARYENAGTVEFILDQDCGEFYFLEMNTRVQVEHPVTEEVTGIDIVKEQIRIAEGESLSLSQDEVRIQGHAIECRINAESVARGFSPSPGVIKDWRPPRGPGIRIDTHCYPGYLVPPYYDSLIAKLIAWGEDRGEAVERMEKALGDFVISGIETNAGFLKMVVGHQDFRRGALNTRWLEDKVLPTLGGIANERNRNS